MPTPEPGWAWVQGAVCPFPQGLLGGQREGKEVQGCCPLLVREAGQAPAPGKGPQTVPSSGRLPGSPAMGQALPRV